MDIVTLSRLQFALTTIYHWLFVPLTLGLGWFVAFFQTRYYQTKDETWHKMAKVLGKIVPDQLCNWRSHRYRAGISVWHELVGILPLCGRYFWRSACGGSSDGLLPGIYIPGHLDFWRRPRI